MIASSRIAQSAQVSGERLRNRLNRANQAFVAMLQGAYMDRPAGDLRWTPDEETTDILITGARPEHIQNSNGRPAISVYRLSAQQLSVTRDPSTGRSMVSQDWTFADIMQCMTHVAVLCKYSAEAEALAYEAKVYMQLFRDLIVRHGCLHSVMNGMSVSEPRPGPASSAFSTWHQVIVQVPWTIQEEFTVVYTDPLFQAKLRQIDTHVTSLLP